MTITNRTKKYINLLKEKKTHFITCFKNVISPKISYLYRSQHFLYYKKEEEIGGMITLLDHRFQQLR